MMYIKQRISRFQAPLTTRQPAGLLPFTRERVIRGIYNIYSRAKDNKKISFHKHNLANIFCRVELVCSSVIAGHTSVIASRTTAIASNKTIRKEDCSVPRNDVAKHTGGNPPRPFGRPQGVAPTLPWATQTNAWTATLCTPPPITHNYHIT
jgi:hypothetical protein